MGSKSGEEEATRSRADGIGRRSMFSDITIYWVHAEPKNRTLKK